MRTTKEHENCKTKKQSGLLASRAFPTGKVSGFVFNLHVSCEFLIAEFKAEEKNKASRKKGEKDLFKSHGRKWCNISLLGDNLYTASTLSVGCWCTI